MWALGKCLALLCPVGKHIELDEEHEEETSTDMFVIEDTNEEEQHDSEPEDSDQDYVED